MARRGGAPGGTRQRKHWHGSTNNSLAITGASTVIASSLDITDPVTILRCLGEVLVGPGNSGIVANDGMRVTFGLGLVTTDAFTVGATAMPDPASEPEFDWLWWYPVALRFPTADGSLVGIASESARIRLETKAMRRASHSETLVLLGQYEDITGTPPVRVDTSFRILIGE